jgi:hypothetical protein
MVIDFNENGVGHIDGTTPLVSGMGTPSLAGPSDQYDTLYYVLPSPVVEGDLVLYEPGTSSQVSDILRFVNENVNESTESRVYVYSEAEQGDPLPLDKADTRIPYDYLEHRAGMDEQGPENDWNGIVLTPTSWQDEKGQWQYMPGYMMQYGEGGVTYNFTSDIPEPATICLLGFGALSLLRRKK